MAIKYGVSPWIDSFPRSRRPDHPRFNRAAARNQSSTAVAIVGGGLSGCCTAYALAAAGVQVILFEADRIGSGGSGRSAGVLRGEASSSFRELDERHGRRAARAMFESSRRAVLDLAATAKRLGIKADVEVNDALRIAPPFSLEDKLFAREVAARREAGLEAVPLRAAAASREAAVERVTAAVRLHDWGQCNPYRLCLGFASAAADRGATIYERSPVRRIKVKRRHVEAHVSDAVIRADTIIICTGEPTDLFRPLKRHMRLDERYAVLTERMPAAVRKQVASRSPVLTDTDTPSHVVRAMDDGHLLVTGADQPRTKPKGRDKVLVQRTGQLMYELLRLYPAISGLMPEYGWDIPMAVTADGAMYAGPHRNYPRHLFAWATGHDPAHAFLASRILLRHVTGEATKDDGYFAFTRGR